MNPSPFLRLLVPLVGGMSAALLIGPEMETVSLYGTLGASICIFMLAWAIAEIGNGSYFKYHRPRIRGICIHALLFIFGIGLIIIQEGLQHPNHFSHLKLEKGWMKAVITKAPSSGKAVARAEADITEAGENNKWIKTKGKILLLFRDTSKLPAYGDELMMRFKFSMVAQPANPGGFDYKAFLHSRNIFHQAKLNKGQWYRTGNNLGSTLRKHALHIRKKINDTFDRYIPGKEEAAVAKALVTGETSDIEIDLTRSFAASGTLHVLSVSGLHVGIIYLAFQLLFARTKHNKTMKITGTVLQILFLWGYALVTGLSPAVLRAALMLSLMIVANGMAKKTDTLNILLGSCFVLLVADPSLLVNTGFQLSFLAVAGILLFQKPLESIWNPRNIIARKIWSLSCVSIAAQLTTLPLSLWIFHTFPTYFIAANLPVIPLATMIMYACIALLMVAFSPVVAGIVGTCCMKGVEWMNDLVRITADMPGATLKINNFDALHLILAYAMLIIALTRNIRKTYPIAILTLAFCIHTSFRKIETVSQKKIILYHLKKGFAMDIIQGNKTHLICDSAFMKSDHAQMEIAKAHDRLMVDGINQIHFDPGKGMTKHKSQNLFIHSPMICFKGFRIMVLNKKNRKMKGKIHADIVILSDAPVMKMEEIIERHHPKIIVIAANNVPSRVEKWKSECKRLRQCMRDVSAEGAFEMPLHHMSERGKESSSLMPLSVTCTVQH
jgi:competence protein ComEC